MSEFNLEDLMNIAEENAIILKIENKRGDQQ